VPLRLCLDCGVIAEGSRCPQHAAERERQRTSAKRQRRPAADQAERARRAAVVDEWVRTRGYVCPGWRREPHASVDLTADHVVAVAAGGREDGELGVLCRACNGSKGARGAPEGPTCGADRRSTS
jgi:hypothetical protein